MRNRRAISLGDTYSKSLTPSPPLLPSPTPSNPKSNPKRSSTAPPSSTHHDARLFHAIGAEGSTSRRIHGRGPPGPTPRGGQMAVLRMAFARLEERREISVGAVSGGGRGRVSIDLLYILLYVYELSEVSMNPCLGES